MKVFNKVFVLLINIYRKLISPLIGARCRFSPTCSQYAKEAFESLPVHIALWKSAVRILKCHPFHPGGYDPLNPKE